MWVNTVLFPNWAVGVQFWHHCPAQTPQVIDRVLYKLDDMAWKPDKLQVKWMEGLCVEGSSFGFLRQIVLWGPGWVLYIAKGCGDCFTSCLHGDKDITVTETTPPTLWKWHGTSFHWTWHSVPSEKSLTWLHWCFPFLNWRHAGSRRVVSVFSLFMLVLDWCNIPHSPIITKPFQQVAVCNRRFKSPISGGVLNRCIHSNEVTIAKSPNFPPKVRPYVHKILVVIEPLLIDEDYFARVEGLGGLSCSGEAGRLASCHSKVWRCDPPFDRNSCITVQLEFLPSPTIKVPFNMLITHQNAIFWCRIFLAASCVDELIPETKARDH